jgi:hypothetical protein
MQEDKIKEKTAEEQYLQKNPTEGKYSKAIFWRKTTSQAQVN